MFLFSDSWSFFKVSEEFLKVMNIFSFFFFRRQWENDRKDYVHKVENTTQNHVQFPLKVFVAGFVSSI